MAARARGPRGALVHRPKYDDWSLPKGKLAAGEHPLVAACREVAEETGVRPVIGQRLPSQSYKTSRGPRSVAYWAMRATTGTFTPTREVDALAWLTWPQAHTKLSYPGDRLVLDALDDASHESSVLLLRHGSAGDPAAWTGADSQRPLDATGYRQAEALRRVLPMFGVTHIGSASRLRCTDTVALLATDLGVPVADEPTLDEDAYAERPALGLRRIMDLAASPWTWAVCSQGNVIVDAVATLAAQDGLPLPPVKAKKGSVWALFFASGKLIAADYYPFVS